MRPPFLSHKNNRLMQPSSHTYLDFLACQSCCLSWFCISDSGSSSSSSSPQSLRSQLEIKVY